MWVYTRRRTEQDKPMLINLSAHSAIQMAQLGNKWFVDAMHGNDSSTLAQVDTQEEAEALVNQIFAGLQSDEKALDLNKTEESKDTDNSHHAPPAPIKTHSHSTGE